MTMSGIPLKAAMLTLVPAVLCSGCGTRYPTDLSFHSARYVDLDLDTYAEWSGRTPKHLTQAVEVHFRTSADLVELRQDYAYMDARYDECDRARRTTGSGISGVFYKNIELGRS